MSQATAHCRQVNLMVPPREFLRGVSHVLLASLWFLSSKPHHTFTSFISHFSSLESELSLATHWYQGEETPLKVTSGEHSFSEQEAKFVFTLSILEPPVPLLLNKP